MAKADPKKAANAAKDKLKNNAVTNAAGGVFAKIKAKTPVDNKKVDEWQKKWLAMPEHRAKYEHLQDAPKVVGEELFAMTNDIIDFCQREGGGQSHIFKSIKENIGGFLKHPAEFLKKRAEEGKKKAMEAKDMAVQKAGEAKQIAEKKAGEAKKATQKAKAKVKK